MSFDEFKKQVLQNTFPVEKEILLRSGGKSITLFISPDPAGIRTRDPVIPLDYMYTMPQKVLATLGAKLGLNQTVFARNCEAKKISRQTAEAFLEHYHLMGFTQSAFNYGLFYKEELIAVASFSKGRKMNRLREDQRSFELIRFCSQSGTSIAGGLSKLVKTFCREKNAGDVMTYIDKQLSDGRSFINAGFKKHDETGPNYFLITKKSFERIPAEEKTEFDAEKFYKTRNCGNLKLIYTPGE